MKSYMETTLVDDPLNQDSGLHCVPCHIPLASETLLNLQASGNSLWSCPCS